MSTVAKGDWFEDEVFELFSKLLSRGQLLFNPQLARIYQKRAYYSKDRADDIVVDISIEVYLPDANQWSLLTVIECKNYTHNVPVDDVEEFSAKLSQIAGHNVKGIVVTSHAFQKGSIKYAESKGIALVRVLPSKEILWDVKRRPRDEVTRTLTGNDVEIEHALTDPNYTNWSVRTFACVGDHFTHSIEDVLRQLHGQSLEPDGIEELMATATPSRVPETEDVPFLGNDSIEQAAKELMRRCRTRGGQTSVACDLDSICKFLQSSREVTFDTATDLGADARGRPILGRMVSLPPTIMVSSAIKTDLERSRFTLAHEIGHLVLGHGEFLNQESLSSWQYESTDIVLAGEKTIERMEIQANKFAAYLLLPRSEFLEKLSSILDMLQIKPRPYILYLDDQQCNQEAFYRVTGKLKSAFKVSRRVVEYHLKNLGLLIDRRGSTVRR